MEQETHTVCIDTSRFGKLDVPESSIITIINGVIGFPDYTRYTLLEYNPPFSWLQSIDFPELAFVVVNAAEFGEGYDFSVPVGDKDIDLQGDDEIAVVNLVSVRPSQEQTTVNLKAPLVVNLKNMRGKQFVLDDPRFPVRMALWSKEEQEKSSAGE